MAWIYEQATGKLWRNGFNVDTGYAGCGDGKNNCAMQDEHNVGPLPVGKYTIEAPHDTKKHGPYAMVLTPDPANKMFGRSGFMIHGDSMHNPGHASEGCIILAGATRKMIWGSLDHDLEVVAKRETEIPT